MADLTTLYRGEPTPFSWLGRTENNMLKGRFFSPDPELARGFANQPGGLIRSMDVTPTQLTDAQKFKSGLKYKKGFDWLNPNKDVVVASKKLLTEAKPSINWGQTLKHNVDVSKLAAEIYGKQGLGFLKNNALRTLAMLGSLPAQVGIMTLMPTRMGNAELPLEKMNQQIAQATSNRDRQNIQNIQQHTGEALSDYRMSRPSSERQYTGHGRSGMGRDPRDRMAMGGLINLYRYGGFI